VRLGILSDIHEAVEPLRAALEICRQEQVDRVVHVGDICRMNRQLRPTVDLLHGAGVTGVWGNHDYGLCGHLAEADRKRFDPEVLRYFETLCGVLEVADCRFCHVEHWLDPDNLEHLWYFQDHPDSVERAARSFQAVPSCHRVLFMGHLHRWLAASPEEILPWNGERPVRLERHQRYLIVVHALVCGHFALYDTETGLLEPRQVPVEAAA
jgi:predicted phosphodiesterase